MENYKNNKSFLKWFEQIKKWEGKISKDARDRGGLTNMGITYKWYKAGKWYKIIGKTDSLDDFYNMTYDDVAKIAYNNFWLPNKIDLIHDEYRKILAMESIWGGGGLNSLGVKNIADLNSNRLTNRQLFENRVLYLKSIKGVGGFATFGKGWMNRLNDVLKNTMQLFTSNPKTGEVIAVSLLFFCSF